MMKTSRNIVSVLVCSLIVACAQGGPGDGQSSPTSRSSSPLAVTAAGSIPKGMPSHLSVGLFENPGATWMKSSGVPWDLRYAYFTYGWADNWGYGSDNGSWGLNFMTESASDGFTPAVEYYCMNGEPGGGQDQFLTKAQDATTMAEYFGDFKILMQNIKSFGKPVVVLMEADGFGFLEEQSNGNPSTYAAVAASGLPELASLPNTVAGWGLAFLQLREAVGASNAVLGIHVSSWASGEDISYVSVTTPLQPQVDTVYSFLSPFGLTANQTGSTYDVLVGDPLDRDSDYYQLVENEDRWWDASDTASIDSASFNRYAAWLSAWNAISGKRWVLWQIPIGNSNMLNVCNNGQPSQGYMDNRPEYFFGSESATHLQSWAQDGVIALLFGAGASCQSSYENDTYTDGQLFLKSRVASFYAGGGLPLTGGGSASSSRGSSSGGKSGSGSSSGSKSGSGSSSGSHSSSGSSSSSSGGGSASSSSGSSSGSPSGSSSSSSSGSSGGSSSSGSSSSGSSSSGGSTPSFTLAATASPSSIAEGATTTINVTVTDTGAALSDGIVDVEIYNASSTQVAQQSFSSQSFSAGQSSTYSYTWTAPTTAGTYTVMLGVFSSGWSTDYAWNSSAASVTVAAGDPSEYGFETGGQGWAASGSGVASVATSTAEAFDGSQSLAVGIDTSSATTATVAVSAPSTPAGATVTFHVFVPSGTDISAVQPFVLQGASGNWLWTGDYEAMSSLTAGAWNTLTVAVPANAATPLSQLGVQFSTNAAWTGTVYVDSVSW